MRIGTRRRLLRCLCHERHAEQEASNQRLHRGLHFRFDLVDTRLFREHRPEQQCGLC